MKTCSSKSSQSTEPTTLRKQPVRSKCDRAGTISIVYLLIAVLCTLLMALIINVGHVVHQKIQMQNAADAAAIAASTWKSRGLNAITATNHAMGEMCGLIIVHDAIGGRELDEGIRANTTSLDSDLTYWAQRAAGLGAPIPAFRIVVQKVYAGKTILKSKKRLKDLLADVYKVKVAAMIMIRSGIPPVIATGKAMLAAANLVEQQIKFEYELLNHLQVQAVSLVSHKYHIRFVMLPAARDYTELVVKRYPKIAKQAAEEVGKQYNVEVAFDQRSLELPVIKDPHRDAMLPPDQPKVQPDGPEAPRHSIERTDNWRSQVVKTSQLAYASFPWVNYHREPILKLLAPAWMSQAAHFYKDFSDGTSKELLDTFQRTGRDNLGLYVLADNAGADRGYELWTEDPERLDELISVQAFAFRHPPKVLGTGIFFPQQHENGRVAYSQALLYNGNTQKRHRHHINLSYKRIEPERQADVGWDTLNWRPSTRPYKLVAKDGNGGLSPEYPQIQLNWQTKLVPIANRLLEKSTSRLPRKYQEVLNGVEMNQLKLQTH